MKCLLFKCDFYSFSSRPPHGGRGLKSIAALCNDNSRASPSPRRAWIEIFCWMRQRCGAFRRPPHGGRGLKFFCVVGALKNASSPSPRRAWIEIIYIAAKAIYLWSSPSPRRAWIEIVVSEQVTASGCTSPSPRRAWIEILPRFRIMRM